MGSYSQVQFGTLESSPWLRVVSTTVISRLIIPTLLVLVCSYGAPSSKGFQDNLLGTSPEQEGEQAAPAADIASVYELAGEAKNLGQLRQIQQHCERLQKTSLADAQRVNIDRLLAWSLYRQGELHLMEAERLFEDAPEAIGSARSNPNLRDVEPDGPAEQKIGVEVDGDGEAIQPTGFETPFADMTPHEIAMQEIRERWDQSSACFRQSLEFNANLARAHHGLGVIFATQGEWESAIAEFEAAIEGEPAFLNAHLNLAECRAAFGDLRQAIEIYTNVLELRPQDPAIYTARGLALLSFGQVDQALVDFRRTTQMVPHEPSAFINRGDAHFAMGSWEKAIDDYRIAMRLNTELSSCYQRAAWALACCPDPLYRNESLAYEMAIKAIELEGRANALTLDTLAVAQAANGWFDDAVQTLDRIPTLDPDGQSAARSARKEAFHDRKPYFHQPSDL